MRMFTAMVAICAAAGAAAQEWEPLDDAGITVLLTAHELVYDDGATQDFRDSGRTLYTFGEPSWGFWRTVEGRYCSQWPPGADWDCYDVAYDGESSVRFVDDYGNVSIGEFAE